jgi:hypothetical protein
VLTALAARPGKTRGSGMANPGAAFGVVSEYNKTTLTSLQ